MSTTTCAMVWCTWPCRSSAPVPGTPLMTAKPCAARYVSQVREVRDDNAPFENRAPVAVGPEGAAIVDSRRWHQRLRRHRPGANQGETRRPPWCSTTLTFRPCWMCPPPNRWPRFAANCWACCTNEAKPSPGGWWRPVPAVPRKLPTSCCCNWSNHAQPLIQHLSQLSPLHPERFYSELVSLAGEFSTFTASGRRPQEYPQYQHDNLALSFAPVISSLA